MNKAYVDATLKMAELHADFVIGFITQHALASDSNWIYFTPGIHLATQGDPLGQQYISPKTAIIENGTDVIIVGRGIIAAKNPLDEARRYRETGFLAYLERLN